MCCLWCVVAYRAINQAVGRVIRHRWDYGAIMLLDERFNQSALQNSLSKWVKASMQHRTGLADVTSSLGQFFAKWTANPPGPAKQASVSPVCFHRPLRTARLQVL